MSAELIPVLFALSLLTPLLAAAIAYLPFAQAHRVSNTILGLGASFGTLVGLQIATGGTGVTPVILPQDLASQLPENVVNVLASLFFNMSFTLDRFAAIFYGLVNGVAALTALYAIFYLPHYQTVYHVKIVNALTGLFVLGMLGVIVATNIIGFMFFWEIMSLSSFFLVMAERTATSRQAAMLYLIMTHVGALALTAGFFLLSAGALLSPFSLITLAAAELSPNVLSGALALLTFGFIAKAGLVPFHVWLPEAHSMAPSHVSALMSGVMLKVALYGFLRVTLFMVPGIPGWLPVVILTLGLLSAVLGVLYAVVERDIKRLLAYSSIENMGLIFSFLAVALFAAQEGNTVFMEACLFAAMFLAIAHAFVKSGLFMMAGTIITSLHTRSLEDMGGLARRMPQFSLVACALALAAAALPPFGPFVAEWTFLQALLGSLTGSSIALTVALVFTLAIIGLVAGLALFAMVKLYAIAFLAWPRTPQAREAIEPEIGLMLPSFLAAAVALLLGLLAPRVLFELGAQSLVASPQVITVQGGSLIPLSLTLVFIAIMAVITLIRYLVTDSSKKREYPTWDCGQPLTPRMEYTATAFSGPIRFFFRFILRTRKELISTPVVATNPWIATKRFNLTINSIWYDLLYVPVGQGLMLLSGLTRRIQSGRIQLYVGLIMAALLVTLVFAV